MVIIKSCQSLDNLNKHARGILLKEEFESKVHPGREESFLLAREALRLALREQGSDVPLQNIILKTYDAADGFPEFTLSLSHTKKCGVAALAKRSEFRSLGVDVEREDRSMREDLVQKISHPGDLLLRNIEIWTLKEAVFKCLSNSHLLKDLPLFTEIQILGNSWVHSSSGLKGEWKLEKLTPFLIALATLKN